MRLATLAILLATLMLTLAACGSSTVRTVTIRAAAPPPIVKTVVKWRTPKTIIKHERVEVPNAPTQRVTPDCNSLPPTASTSLTQLRESRCEVEKLNAENPSPSQEHEIEAMITEERSIEASE